MLVMKTFYSAASLQRSVYIMTKSDRCSVQLDYLSQSFGSERENEHTVNENPFDLG